MGETQEARLARTEGQDLPVVEGDDETAAAVERRGVGVSELYRKGDQHPDVLELAEALLDHDEGFRLWRIRHVQMVERQIGDKHGTGGSSGVRYLQSTLGKRFFPELWEVRSEL